MLLNVEVKTDTHANVFPVKGDMKSKNKIDGFISLLCSLDAQNDPTYNVLLENNWCYDANSSKRNIREAVKLASFFTYFFK